MNFELLRQFSPQIHIVQVFLQCCFDQQCIFCTQDNMLLLVSFYKNHRLRDHHYIAKSWNNKPCTKKIVNLHTYFFGGLISSRQTGHSSSDRVLERLSAFTLSVEFASIMFKFFRESLRWLISDVTSFSSNSSLGKPSKK